MSIQQILPIFFLAFVILEWTAQANAADSVDNAAPLPLAGIAFRQELEKPFAASWSSEPFRAILTTIAANRRVSVVLDRRLDPSRELQVAIKDVTLAAALRELALRDNGHLCIPGNFVYLGPESATKRLRTLIELRSQELKSKDLGVAASRQTELQRRRTVNWPDLQSPKEILESICTLYRIRCENPDILPHDLWAAARLPDANFVESISTVLIQFDLTFQWRDKGEQFEIVPLPERALIERKYTPNRKAINDLVSQLQDEVPDAQIQKVNNSLIVQATVEDHEAIDETIRGSSNTQIRKASPLKPVKQRSFTFSSNQPVPLIALMKKLEESDIRFEYDPKELQAAGVDLDRKIDLDVKNMPAPAFFKSIFDSSQIEFEFDQTTIKLRPKK